MEPFIIEVKNVPYVLTAFFNEFKCNPLHGKMTIEEITELFFEQFPKEWDNTVAVEEEALKTFLSKINDISCDRAINSLIKKGIVDYMHDGTDFVFSLVKKGN